LLFFSKILYDPVPVVTRFSLRRRPSLPQSPSRERGARPRHGIIRPSLTDLKKCTFICVVVVLELTSNIAEKFAARL